MNRETVMGQWCCVICAVWLLVLGEHAYISIHPGAQCLVLNDDPRRPTGALTKRPRASQCWYTTRWLLSPAVKMLLRPSRGSRLRCSESCRLTDLRHNGCWGQNISLRRKKKIPPQCRTPVKEDFKWIFLIHPIPRMIYATSLFTSFCFYDWVLRSSGNRWSDWLNDWSEKEAMKH